MGAFGNAVERSSGKQSRYDQELLLLSVDLEAHLTPHDEFMTNVEQMGKYLSMAVRQCKPCLNAHARPERLGGSVANALTCKHDLS